ncbi:MAG: serine/threonine-protein phosphatase, partial [Akkermansia sp.]
ADLVRNGTMTHQEMLRRGNMLRSAVTGESIPLVDAPPTPYPVLPGDKIILCSDGLDDLLLGSTLPESTRKLLASRGGNPAALLIDACREMNKPYADNATAITLDVQAHSAG